MKRFCLCLPMPLELRSESRLNCLRSECSDIYMTGYAPLDEVLQVGKGDTARVYRLAYALDRCQSNGVRKV